MKPLTYQCQQMVLQEMSFLKRKELYAKCPAIRKQEVQLGYRVNGMTISQTSKQCEIHVDNFKININDCPEDETKKCGITMTNNKTGITVKKSIDMDPEEAAEKWISYILDRPNTRIQLLQLHALPICILKLDQPMTVIKLTIFVFSGVPKDSGRRSWVKTTVPVKHLKTIKVFRDDTMKSAQSVVIPRCGHIYTEILSEWQANEISIDNSLSLGQIITYCMRIKDSGRPIGFRFDSWIEDSSAKVLDSLAEELNARKTSWNGRDCVTIPLNNASELNIHGELVKLSDRLTIEVNAKGTAIDR
uniref:FBA_2 domain-containing protein n=1 Tax=Caenorhabditis tropicalis TaxID=1561998 RepID=A0A1I7V123_9PELO